jgi:hypothetical protein
MAMAIRDPRDTPTAIAMVLVLLFVAEDEPVGLVVEDEPVGLVVEDKPIGLEVDVLTPEL